MGGFFYAWSIKNALHKGIYGQKVVFLQTLTPFSLLISTITIFMRAYLPIIELYSLFGFITILACIALNAFLLRYLKQGVRSEQALVQADWVRWAATPKPAIGGIGFFVAFVGSLLGYALLYCLDNPYITIPLANWQPFIAFVAACTIGFAIGLIDDARQIRPLAKFAGQLASGLLFIAGGMYIPLSDYYVVNYLFTLFWVIGIMNSLNMLDNMDGITASVSFFVLCNILLMMAMNGQLLSADAIIVVVAMGSLLGFLWYNWNPSRMFMGDAGSQFLGALLAGLSIKYLWQFRDTVHGIASLQQFLMPILAFLLSLIDTTTVTVRRLARGQSPFVGGRDHTTHHLVYCGLTDKQVAYLFIALSILGLYLAYYTRCYLFTDWSCVHTAWLIGYFLFIFGLMQFFYEYGKRKKASGL